MPAIDWDTRDRVRHEAMRMVLAAGGVTVKALAKTKRAPR
jgi:hypothetical protein